MKLGVKSDAYKKIVVCEDVSCRGCQERLFTVNQPLVRFVLSKYFPGWRRPNRYGPERDGDDLLQAGRMGLWYAIQKRDPSKNPHEFRGYAFRCVHGYICQSMRDIGKDAYSRANDGERPVVFSTDFTVDRNQNARASLFTHRDCDGDFQRSQSTMERMKDFKVAQGNRPWWDPNEFDVNDKIVLERLVERLDERTRQILLSRFDGDTLEGITKKVGLISRERVRQLQERALSELFHMVQKRRPTAEEVKTMTNALSTFEG